MKHPVLRVKRGKETYDDSENKKVRPDIDKQSKGETVDWTDKRRGPFLRGRRGFLLPLLILIVLALAIFRMMPRSVSQANLGGWRIFLQAVVLGDMIEVGVGFSRLDPKAAGIGSGPQVASVLFELPDTRERAHVSGILSGSRMALTTRMHRLSSSKNLRAFVRIDGESRTLSLAVTSP